MINLETEKEKNKEDFFAIVSAITRFIETADEENKTNTERGNNDGSYA
ncbi:MAG: hypothetical protein FWF78_01295 [Defluviitaleaceae bacterium]|nr:hypothetical protein [Defluviitaleaceae bacterium]